MSDPKDFNQQQYSKNYQRYLDSNTKGNIGGGTPQERVDLLMKYLPTERKVFEIGSGEGLDSLALQKTGYTVTASDYVEEFVNILKKKGLEAIKFDAKNNELTSSFDCLYANAVFVHFSPEEISEFLMRSKEKLTNEKVIFISVIKGEGRERSSRTIGFERDFHYYTSGQLKDIFDKAGYQVLYFNDDNDKWIQTIITGK